VSMPPSKKTTPGLASSLSYALSIPIAMPPQSSTPATHNKKTVPMRTVESLELAGVGRGRLAQLLL
jgi:hypothetical protein